jgi:hypothetical protein
MWNIVLSLCIFVGAEGTPKAVEGRLLTAVKRATTAGNLVRGKVLLFFVKKGMTLRRVESVLGKVTAEYVCGIGGISGSWDFGFGECVEWRGEHLTINEEQVWHQTVTEVHPPSVAEIWAALTGGKGDWQRRLEDW